MSNTLQSNEPQSVGVTRRELVVGTAAVTASQIVPVEGSAQEGPVTLNKADISFENDNKIIVIDNPAVAKLYKQNSQDAVKALGETLTSDHGPGLDPGKVSLNQHGEVIISDPSFISALHQGTTSGSWDANLCCKPCNPWQCGKK